MSSQVDHEFTRVVKAISETAATRPALTIDASSIAPMGSQRRLVPARGLVAASVAIVALGVVALFAVVAEQDESAPILLAMSNSEEPAVAVGTFPHLVVEQPGWVLGGIEETSDSADYRYVRGDQRLAIHIEFGGEDALNALLSKRTTEAAEVYNVFLTEVGEQQVALVESEAGGTTWITIWGVTGRVYEMVASPMTSDGEVLDIFADITIADDARWAEAVSGLSES